QPRETVEPMPDHVAPVQPAQPPVGRVAPGNAELQRDEGTVWVQPLFKPVPQLFTPSENRWLETEHALLPIDDVGDVTGIDGLRTQRRGCSEQARRDRLQLDGQGRSQVAIRERRRSPAGSTGCHLQNPRLRMNWRRWCDSA